VNGGPALRIVRGEPTDEELAALTVVLAAAGRPGEPERSAAEQPSWNRAESRLRRPLHPGPGAWRASARPG
jgi:Acyl-CoA carboxylase epsilon subunit